MDYLTIAEARGMSGLRLVLTAHLPGPWGESAKAILRARGVAFAQVEQTAMGANDELVAWTGLRNAPIAMLDQEPPVHGWLDLAMLAERLGAGESLLPERSADRALALGLSAEICAPYGFGWSRRLDIMASNYSDNDALPDAPAHIRAMLRGYGFSRDAVHAARQRIPDILATLADQLARQRTAGSRYMVLDRPSITDLHWACFSQMVAPLDVADQPAMPPWLSAIYGDIDPDIAAALDPILIEHRDFIFRTHIGLPLDY